MPTATMAAARLATPSSAPSAASARSESRWDPGFGWHRFWHASNREQPVTCQCSRRAHFLLQNPTVEWKVCRRCGTNKPAADFYRNKTNSDGLYNNCKSCFSQDAQHRRERLPPLEERTASAKECRRCKETKPASEFYKNKHMSDGLYTHCKVRPRPAQPL